MPTALPVVRGTSSALYPFVQTFMCLTDKSDAESGAATRNPAGFPRVRFDLPYQPVTQSQKNTLKSAMSSALGQFATDRTLTTDITYTNLSFDVDEFSATEGGSTLYGVKWSLTQMLPQNFSPGASGGAFPALSNGAICQRPFTQKQQFRTIVSAVESGPKYTFAEFGGGLSNFPNRGLMAWDFDEPNLTDAEVSTKVAHFLANWGDCFAFSFTDEDSTVYNTVHYGSPNLVITRIAKNQSRIHTTLIETL